MPTAVLDEIEFAVDNELPPPIDNEEAMKRDQDWIRHEIRDALRENIAEQIVPLVDSRFGQLSRSWRYKVWPILLNVGVISLVVSIIIALFITTLTEHNAATTRATEEAKFEQKTSDRLDAVEGQLKTIQGSLANLRLSALSGEPVTKDSVAAVKQIITTASSEHFQIDQSVVTQSGKYFVEASQHNTEAWPAVEALLYYATVHTAYPHLVATYGPPEASPARLVTYYQVPGGFTGKVLSSGYDKHSDIAELRKLGGGNDPNTASGHGSGYWILRGSTVNIDGMRMKHVIIENAVVRYSGAPASLEDVYFINCTFDIQPKTTGQMLASAIFSDPSVKLEAS